MKLTARVRAAAHCNLLCHSTSVGVQLVDEGVLVRQPQTSTTGLAGGQAGLLPCVLEGGLGALLEGGISSVPVPARGGNCSKQAAE